LFYTPNQEFKLLIFKRILTISEGHFNFNDLHFDNFQLFKTKNNKMKKIILLGILYLVFTVPSHSQGCLPIRNIAGFEQFSQLGYSTSPDTWMINISGRYFKAFQPINGTTKVPIPASAADRWINYNRTLNISINKALENDWSLALDVPMYSNESIGKKEHRSGDRHATNSIGLGDIRFTVYKWILKSDSTLKGNI
jgi:hypothetical protein